MGRPRSLDYEEARRLRAAGLTYDEIAGRLDGSYVSAWRACQSAEKRAALARDGAERARRTRARRASE